MKHFVRHQRRREYIRQFYRGNLFLLLLNILYIIVLTIGAGLMISWLLQVIIDVATGDNTDYTLRQLMLLCVLDAVIVCFGFWLAWISKPKWIARAIGQYKEYVFQKLSQKGISAFHEESTAFYLSALSNDANTIETDFLANIPALLEESLLFLGSLILMLWYSPFLTAIGVGLALLPVTASLLAGNQVAKAEEKVSEHSAIYVSSLTDCLSGFAVIKSFRAEVAMCRQISQCIRNVTEVKTLRRKIAIMVQCIGTVAGLIAQFGVFLIGAALSVHGHAISAGTLIAFVNLMNYVVTPISSIPQYLAQCKSALVLIDRLADALAQNIREDGSHTKSTLHTGISVKNLSFSYGEAPVLQNISVDFEAGKSYAIVGASGSGKSTLLNLLLASSPHYTGHISYDDTDLRQLSSDSLYQMVSMVQQNVFIFNASVRDNITMFSDFPDAQVTQAIQLSGMSEFIAQRGETYLCGENGSGLSGGEKQRISIARSLLKHTQVLLVDEATAALDPPTAAQIAVSLLNLSDVTRIVVTHRLDEALLRRYDCIITLKNGTIQEQGTFEQLMEHKGYFYSLFTVSQF